MYLDQVVLYIGAYAGKGKVSAYKLMCKDQKYQQAFTEFGSSWTLTEETERVLEAFMCQLYGGKNLSDINACHYKFFCFKKGKLSQTNCHLVMTVYTNILSGATIKLMFGEDVWNAIRRSLLQMDMVG